MKVYFQHGDSGWVAGTLSTTGGGQAVFETKTDAGWEVRHRLSAFTVSAHSRCLAFCGYHATGEPGAYELRCVEVRFFKARDMRVAAPAKAKGGKPR